MMRANLLPHTSDRVRIFGFSFDAEHVRATLAGLALVLLIAALGATLERARIARMTSSLDLADATIASHAPQRSAVRRVIADVARYRAFVRDSARFRRSGTDAALAIARIGNAIPAHVWLDRIERDAGGYSLAGSAQTIEAVGRTMVALDKLGPSSRAELVSLDATGLGQTGDLRFSARVLSPEIDVR